MIFLIIPIYQRNFQFTIKSNLWFLYFCLILQCDWSRKVVLLSGIIRFKSKNDCHLATYIFPCYEQFSWFYWEFISAHCYVLLCSDWLVAVITLHLVLWHPTANVNIHTYNPFHQIFLLACDWSKCVMQPKTSHLNWKVSSNIIQFSTQHDIFLCL